MTRDQAIVLMKQAEANYERWGNWIVETQSYETLVEEFSTPKEAVEWAKLMEEREKEAYCGETPHWQYED